MQPDYDSIVQKMVGQEQAPKLRGALAQAYGTNPDMEAELRRVSQRTGVPLSTVRNRPDELKRAAYVNGINAQEIAGRFPIFARFMVQQDNAKLAHDDVDNLTALERAVRALPDEFGSMTGPAPTFGSYVSGIGQSFASGVEQARQGIRQQFADVFGFEEMSDDAQRRFAGAQMQSQMATPEFESSTAQGIYGGFSSLAQMAPAVAAGLMTRSPALALGIIGGQTQAQAYPKYRLRGADPAMALLGSTGEGAVEVVTEMLPMGFLVNRFGKAGAGEFLTGFLARELPTEQIATLVQDAIDTAVANPDKTWGEYLAERPDAAYQTALGTLVASGVFGGMNAAARRFSRQDEQAQQAELSAQQVEQINKLAQASQLAKRDPDTFEQFIEQASENGPIQNVYLDANTLMQSGLAEPLAQLSPSVAEQLPAAAAANGLVSIPVSEYAARIAPTEYAQSLLDYIKTEPDGFSRTEAREYMQGQAQEMQQEVELILADRQDADTFRASQQRVKDRVLGELNTLGRFTSDKNEIDATLIAARTAVRAAQLGITPEQLFERQTLQFAAERIDGQQFDQGGGNLFDVTGLTREQERELIRANAETLAEQLRNNGFDVDVQHSGSAAGPSSYLKITDPKTGRYLKNDIRLSGHAKGAFNSQFVWNVATQDDFNAVVQSALAMREKGVSSGAVAIQNRQRAILDKKLKRARRRLAEGKTITESERAALDAENSLRDFMQENGNYSNGPNQQNPNILYQSRRKRDDYTLDLFGVPETPGNNSETQPEQSGVSRDVDSAAQISRDDSKGTFANRTTLVVDVERKLGAKQVTNAEEAAQALAYLGRNAVERLDALVTDANGKPLAIVGSFKGALSQASVYPATLIGEAFRVPGAANIWLAHNHPSGRPELSNADINLARALGELFRGSEIEMHGLFAIAGGAAGQPRGWTLVDGAGKQTTGIAQPIVDGVTVPAVDRVYSKSGQLGPIITSPTAAKDIAKKIANGESGVLLLDSGHAPVGFIPLDAGEMGELRHDGRMDSLYRAISTANAGAAMFVSENGAYNESQIKNVAGLFRSVDVRVLDVFEVGEGPTKSWAEQGRSFEGDTFKQNQRAPRGAFNPDNNTIALLKNADLSTFLHEAGHYFFEADIALAGDLVENARIFGDGALSEGEQQIVDDVSTLLRWHGISGPIEEQLLTWANLNFEEKRAYHERTAESFELYLFEGKAPSIELESYFQTFRAWLLNVYRSIKDFLVRNPEAGQLNDEVRAIFDRMLATNEQIELAQRARSMMPLFRTPADAENIGMTPEEFAAYQKQDTQASVDAAQDLETKALRDLQWLRNARNREIKKLQRRAADLRRQARMDVRREAMAQPVYRAWQFLTGKMTEQDALPSQTPPKSDPDVLDPTLDSLMVAVAKLGGIKKDEALREWGLDPKESPQSGLFGKPVLRVTEGRTIDEMRQLLVQYGYLDGNYADPNWNPREFEDKFDAELRGDTQYSNQVSELVFLPEPRAGEGIDLSDLGAGRLDLASLRELGFSEDQINVLKARKMTAKEGLHPDLVADLPGVQLPSGQDLVQAILEAPPPRDVIESLTDARMLEEHGELATPDAIEREADRAIHNEARARMVATEANALARATGKRRILTQAARQFAAAMVARVRVRNLRPAQYSNAAARAGKAAEKAQRSGDIELAGAEKRNQLVNLYAAKAAFDAREEVDSAIRYLRKFEADSARKGLDVDYLDQIDTLLERFDLRQGQSLRAIDKRASLAEWVAQQEEQGFEPDIPAHLIQEANRTHYKNLTVEEMRGLVDTVRQIEHLGRLKKKLLTAKDQRELDAIVQEITDRIEASANGRVVDNEVRATLGSRASAAWRGAMAAHRKAGSVVREMDGFTDGGPLWEYFTRSMNEAGDREATMRADAATRLHELAKPILAGEEMGGRGRFFPTLGRNLNRGERLAIALNWGNEGNRQRLLDGRNWTAQQIQPVLDSLTVQDWQFVQGVWGFFESYRPMIAAKEKRVYGKEPDWIDPSPFTVQTADGQTMEIAGGYYPVKYDPRQSGKAGEFAEAEEAKAMMRAAHTAATTRRSFTKTRADRVMGRPLLLTFDGIWQGANEVIHDLAWHEWLIDANRLIKRLDSPIRTHYGAEYVDVLRGAIKDTARGDQPAADAVEKALGHARNGVTIIGMGWNLTTALMQPLGLTNSVVRVGAKWMAKGASQFYGSPLQMAEKARQVRAMSPFMENRALTLNREINDVRNRLEARSEWNQKLEATYFILIQKVQASVDYPTWLGAYEKAMADPANLRPDGTVNEARAIALADQAVIDSQGGGQIKDLSSVQRGGPLKKLFTNFYSYFNVLMNMTVEQTRMRTQKKQYAALAGDYLLLMVVPAVMSAIIRNALKGEDDEDEYVKSILAELVGYPFGMFVGLREMAGAVQYAAGVGGPFQYGGPAGLRLFAEMDRLGQQVGQGELDMALFKSANTVGGILFHYPAGQVNRLVDGAAALIEGKTDNPLAPITGYAR